MKRWKSEKVKWRQGERVQKMKVGKGEKYERVKR